MVSRSVLVAVTLFTGNALSAEHSVPPTKPPVEVKIVSVPPAPPAQPTEVKIVSMPATPPPQVKVVLPEDDAARNLVRVTWGLLIANVLLCAATFGGSWWQSRDTKRRDRAAMMREVSRTAHKVMTEATRVDQMAVLIPTARTQLHVLLGQGGLPPQLKEATDKTLTERRAALSNMVDKAGFVVPAEPNAVSPLLALSDSELTARLWELDKLQVQLEAMRDAITEELGRYETESATLRQQRTAMQAASLAGRLPLKTKLGE